MSGIKDEHLATFLRLIRHRLGGAGVLAEFAGVGRCHLSSMLNGDSERGVYTWGKIRRHVTAVEWSFLEQCSAWNSFEKRYPFHAENVKAVRVCDSPEDPLMPVVCGDCYHALKSKRCVVSQAGRVSTGLCADCFTTRLRGLRIGEAEIAQRIAADADKDRADPSVILVGRPDTAQADLFTATQP